MVETPFLIDPGSPLEVVLSCSKLFRAHHSRRPAVTCGSVGRHGVVPDDLGKYGGELPTRKHTRLRRPGDDADAVALG